MEHINGNWVTIANLVLLIGIVIRQARWQQRVDDKVSLLQEHVRNQEIHTNFEKSSKLFVPRIELDTRLAGIERTLERIDNKIQDK